MEDQPSTHDVTLRRATAGDRPRIERLVASGRSLSAGGIDRVQDLFVAEAGAGLVGSIGLDILGGDGLLRLVCIGAEWRESDLGRLLVEAMLTEGALQALDAVYVYTESDSRVFAPFGFLVISREEVPSAVGRWAEVHGCATPSSVAMRVQLVES
jgi:amino-acid N-acetyltransferase